MRCPAPVYLSSALFLLAACGTPTPSSEGDPPDEESSETDPGTSESSTSDTSDPDMGTPEPVHVPELIVDEQGRARILHGINVHNRSKYQPDRLPTITPEDVERMAHDWGFNVVRLLIFWDAIEPQPGAYDDAYLAAIGERIAWFAAEDIEVILDMHQDVYSEVFCCDGAPLWAVRDDGEPFDEASLWSANYLQPAVQRAFDNLWLGDAGAHADVQEHYVLAWRHVAETFAGTPNLIGYDLMNEPHPGSAWTFADLDSPAPSPELVAWGAEGLTPFYQRITDAIREVDEDSWIMFEPRYGAPAAGRPAVVQPLDDPRADGPRLVYYPHLYPIEPEIFDRYTPSNPTLPNWETERTAEQALFGSAMMLGEFGVFPDWSFGAQLLEDMLALADRTTSGWTYWSYDTNGRGIVDAEGNERESAGILTRPYARLVAGTPTTHVYDPASRELHLVFEHRVGVSGPTEIYIPAARWYPEGWTIELDDPDESWSSSWDAEREQLSVTTSPDESPHELWLRPST